MPQLQSLHASTSTTARCYGVRLLYIIHVVHFSHEYHKRAVTGVDCYEKAKHTTLSTLIIVSLSSKICSLQFSLAELSRLGHGPLTRHSLATPHSLALSASRVVYAVSLYLPRLRVRVCLSSGLCTHKDTRTTHDWLLACCNRSSLTKRNSPYPGPSKPTPGLPMAPGDRYNRWKGVAYGPMRP